MRYVISSSYGNDSMAMIQYAFEKGLKDITVVYCDTGWSAPKWKNRIIECERFVKKCGYTPVIVKSIGMSELVRIKSGFPSNQHQYCTAHLKGVPFLEWIDEADTKNESIVMVGKRRAESEKRKDTPEYIYFSEYHGGRTLWHPLYLHTYEMRNELLKRAGIEILPHRSLECNPCVNANRSDFLRLTKGEIERVNDLEVEVSHPMFRAKRFGSLGIHGVMVWAKDGRSRASIEDEESECAGLFGCGL